MATKVHIDDKICINKHVLRSLKLDVKFVTSILMMFDVSKMTLDSHTHNILMTVPQLISIKDLMSI